MAKGNLIANIHGVNFYYHSWNEEKQCHMVFAEKVYGIEKAETDFPSREDCELIYEAYIKNKQGGVQEC